MVEGITKELTKLEALQLEKKMWIWLRDNPAKEIVVDCRQAFV